MNDEQRAAYTAALIREREGYKRAGKHDRAEQVTAELRRIGAEGVPPHRRAERRPRPTVEAR